MIRLDKETMERMIGLVPMSAERVMQDAVKEISHDFLKEGFEKSEIIAFLYHIVRGSFFKGE